MASTVFSTGLKHFRENRQILFVILIPLVNLGFTPLLSRLVNPILLGEYSTYLAVLSIASIFLTFKGEAMMFKQGDESAFKKIANTCVSLLKYTSFLFVVPITIFWLVDSNQSNSIIWVIVFTPLLLYATGIDMVNRMFQIRLGRSAVYYRISFFRNFFKNSGAIAVFSLSKPSFAAFLAIEVVSRLFALNRQMRQMKTTAKEKVVSWLIQNKKETIFYSVSLLVNTVSSVLPLILIRNVDAHIGGVYAMFYRVLSIPAALVSTVFADKFSDQTQTHGQRKNIAYVLLVFTFLFLVVLLSLPDVVYTSVFGEEWRALGAITRTLAPSLVLEMFFSSVSIFMLIGNKMLWKYWFDALYLVATVLPFMWLNIGIDSQLALLNVLRCTVTILFSIIIVVKLIR